MNSKDHIYHNIQNIPKKNVALVLGTSKYISNGKENPYFTNRMNTAASLFRSNKINYILVSGDNSEIYYNEPINMKKELIKRGIPDSIIYLDYAGFRTLDAVIRAKEIFNQDEFIIVSQKFHNERAVYIARKKGINAIAINADDIEVIEGMKTRIRELFARVKVFIDIYIINKQPKFLGEKIQIGSNLIESK
jgi:SanA protein